MMALLGILLLGVLTSLVVIVGVVIAIPLAIGWGSAQRLGAAWGCVITVMAAAWVVFMVRVVAMPGWYWPLMWVVAVGYAWREHRRRRQRELAELARQRQARYGGAYNARGRMAYRAGRLTRRALDSWSGQHKTPPGAPFGAPDGVE